MKFPARSDVGFRIWDFGYRMAAVTPAGRNSVTILRNLVGDFEIDPGDAVTSGEWPLAGDF